MKRNLWFRMYASILDLEDKTQELSDKSFRQWVALLCLYTRNDRVMPPDASIARCLNLSTRKFEDVKQSLLSAGLMDLRDEKLVPHNWDERQFESDTAANRTAKYRERVRNSGAVVNAYLRFREEIYARDQSKCVYCGSGENLCLDHVIPVILGGIDSVDNLATACKRCNSGKSGRTPEQAGMKIIGEGYRHIYAEMRLSHPASVTVTQANNVTVTVTPSENREQRTENIPPLPPEGEAPSGSGSAKKRLRPTKTEPLPEPEGFAEFYQSYPRHTARSLAALAYGKHVRNGDGPKVMEALRAEMPELMRKDECYRPMPATWLNQERWRDREGISAEEDFWNPIN